MNQNFPVLQKLMKQFVLALVVLSFARSVSAETPIWSFKGVKWYSMMETGIVMVGKEQSIAMLDGTATTAGKTAALSYKSIITLSFDSLI